MTPKDIQLIADALVALAEHDEITDVLNARAFLVGYFETILVYKDPLFDVKEFEVKCGLIK
jgi:hypothetical protein